MAKGTFFPRKPAGKVLLILDGHAAHESSIEMLEFAIANDIILMCLPSHSTQALQPLDRSFFKPFKVHYRHETQNWVKHHPQTPLKRIHVGALIGNAWTKSAVASNCISGFKITGIFPLNRNAVPEHFFQISDKSQTTSNVEMPTSSVPTNVDQASAASEQSVLQHTTAFPGTSTESNCLSEHTPSKHLQKISPLPVLKKKENKRKKSARVLDFVSIEAKKKKMEKKQRSREGNRVKENKNQTTTRGKNRKVRTDLQKMSRKVSSSESDVNELETENICLECLEEYYSTKLPVDWIQCIDC